MIHETAIIKNDVQIGNNVQIGAYTIIEPQVTIGDNTTIKDHAIIRRHTKIDQHCIIDSFAIIGGDPQDITFNCNKMSGVSIGRGTIIREHATIHRATKEEACTIIGQDCYIMSGAHVGHDCVVGNKVILANCSLLGGFVTIGDHCFIGGSTAIHQWVHIGEYVILGGYSATSLDLPPYIMSVDRSKVIGLNIIGLKRAQFSSEKITELKKCLTLIYNTPGEYSKTAKEILESLDLKFPESKNFLKFFTMPSKRGIAPLRKKARKGN